MPDQKFPAATRTIVQLTFLENLHPPGAVDHVHGVIPTFRTCVPEPDHT